MRQSAILLSTLLLLLAAACGSHTSKNSSEDAYTHVVYQPQYATGFRILSDGHSHDVVIESINPWQGADSVTTRLLIVRHDEAPADFHGQVIIGEPQRIVVMSSTFVAMLDTLGVADRIAGVSGIDYISNPHVQMRRDSIADIGYEASVDYEKLLALRPDLVILYGVSAPSPMESKLQQLAIPYIYIGDYLEQSPLGKAEWLVAMGEITGRRDKAIEIFSAIPPAYMSLRDSIARSGLTPPQVMVNTPYADSWFMPSTQSYMVRLIADAGGRYLYDRDTGNASSVIDLEEALRLTSQADLWINTGSARSLPELLQLAPRMADTRCVTQGNVYNNTARSTPTGGNDFYESAVIRPHVVLRDLITIFHPSADNPPLVYYQQLQ